MQNYKISQLLSTIQFLLSIIWFMDLKINQWFNAIVQYHLIQGFEE